MNKKALITISGLVALSMSAHAALTLTAGGSPVTENFDSLVATGNQALSATIGAQVALGTSTFEGAKIAGTGATAMNLTASTGAATSGALYSFGNGTATNRALGAIASGSNTAGFGVKVINGTGFAMTQLTVSFTEEQWRSSSNSSATSFGVVNTIAASYAKVGTSGVTDTNFISAASGFTAVSSLDLVGRYVNSTTAATYDGTLAANQRTVSFVLDFSSSPIAAGGGVYLRWQDFNDIANDAGIGMDNISFTASVVPEPGTLAALGLGAAAVLRRRKK